MNIKKNSSITQRLTLFYTLATSFLLTLTTLSLYEVMVDITYKSEHQLLSDQIEILQRLIKQKQPIKDIPTILGSSVYDYYIRILDADRHIFTETTDMQKYLKDTDFFNQKIEPEEKQSAWWHAQDGTDYLLMQSSVQTGQANQPYWIIQVALDVTYQHKSIKEYRNKLIAGLLIGTLCALIIGYYITRKNIRRLDELTETTRKITASSLHQRINPDSWPRELSTLGTAFNQMLDRIEVSFSRLTQFSDDLAHELRTPINNLIGETEVALFTPTSAEEYKQVLESNLEELHRVSQLIENILFLARAENPSRQMQKILLHVNHEVSVVVDFYRALIDEKNITIIQTGHASIHANPDMFRRMLSNILSNAINYTPVNGKICFEILETSQDVKINIRDNGIGIESLHLSKLFDRFYRVDSARSHLSGGTGLGLAIVKSIIDLHKGTIVVESIPGQSTAFTLSLPKMTKL